MSATNRAPQLQPLREHEPEVKACASPAADKARTLLGAGATDSPALKVLPLLRPELPRRFVRVPTHAVGVFPEHREYPRASLGLPLRLRSVNRVPEEFPITLVTRDISSTGVYFLCPKPIPLNTPIELEIVLVSRPMGHGNVVIVTLAHVRRTEPAAMPGWHGIAASYDDVEFDRDDGVPSRFLFL
jgi:PilZ domain